MHGPDLGAPCTWECLIVHSPHRSVLLSTETIAMKTACGTVSVFVNPGPFLEPAQLPQSSQPKAARKNREVEGV